MKNHIKLLLFVGALSGCLQVVQAKSYPVFGELTTINVNAEQVDMAYVTKVIEDIYPYAYKFPTQFDSEADQNRARSDVKILMRLFDTQLKANPESTDLLRWAALVNRMGHNLDIPKAAITAARYYQKLLDLQPDSAQTNYDYGVFLSEIGQFVKGEPYIHRAIALGDKYAEKGLAFNYMMQGKNKQAMSALRRYLKQNPSDGSAKLFLDTIEKGGQIRKGRAPGPD